MTKLAKILLSTPVACLFLTSAVDAQEHPNLARGLSAGKSYDDGPIDTVDLFSGALHLSIPIGSSYPVNGNLAYALGLSYTSKVWDNNDTNVCYENSVPHNCVESLPMQTANAGMGFTLTLGELLPPSSPKNDTNFWVYLGADGGKHNFYDRLHEGDPAVTGVCFTRDNTYLRLKGVGACVNNTTGLSATIEFPDGTYQTFSRSTNSAPFQLSSIKDRFTNQISVAYLTGPVRWQISDSHRTQTVHFKTSSITGRQIVDKVVLTTPAGPATWQFNYRPLSTSTIQRSGDDQYSCWQTDPCANANVNVDLLSSIVLPDGSSYAMDVYETAVQPNATGGQDVPGALKQVKLPTGGILQWDYQAYDFVQRLVSQPDARLWVDVIGTSAGVKAKRLLQADGSCAVGAAPACDWTYTLTPGVYPTYDRKLVVRSPLGFETVNWFAENDNAWNYGLPMKSTTDGAGRYLSQEIYQGVEGVAKKRSVYMRYDTDNSVNSGYNRNSRVASQRTTFHDDGNRWTAVDYANWDTLGHYRQSDTSGNFDAANARSEFTGWGGGQPAAASPWLLNIFWDRQATEGASVIRNLNCFGASTGVITRIRVLKNAGQLSPDDLLIEYVRDAQGNVTSERYYGGDNQPSLSTTDTCVFALPAPVYRIDNVYQYGSLKSSQHGGAGFLDVDNDLDSNSGLPLTSRDSALVATAYQYDTMHRVTWVKPAQDAWVSYVYSPASVKIRRYPNGTATGQLTDELIELDPFGRVYREKRRTPSGVWAKRTTFFNAMGWKTDVSEWQQDGVSHSAFTKYLNYDPFGRPTIIRPPDGSAHDVTLSYAGVRSINRTTKVATGSTGGESSSTTTEIYDRQGRLYQVKEPSGAAGAVVTTTYGYDAAGRLKSTSTPSGSTQNRSFTYDARGFLTSECHPEKGVSGNGCVSYSLYDARGHAGRKVDGPNDLRFFYNPAERLTQINNNSTGQPLKVFTYGTGIAAGDRSRGKVKTAARYNTIAAPFNATVLITETYTYGGDQGRVSQRDTQNNFNGSNNELFRQTFAWNDLGDLSSQTYPDCAGYCTPSTPRTVSYGYTDGRLTSVPGFLSSITYNLSGLVNIVNHTNGTWDRWTADTSFTGRPANIEGFTNNWNPVPFGLWTTGAFQYDGAGNIKRMGNSTYTYDAVSRLVSATVYPGSYSNGTPQTQSYTFDAFGNMQSKTTNGVTTNTPTTASSNHLSGTSYDGAGNQLSWNGATYEYDKLSMMTRMVNGAEDWRYIYTADDERFWSYRVGGGGSLWTLRGLDGKALRSYNAHVNWSNLTDYVYREGTLASAVTNGAVSHLHPDHLGTPRLISSATGGADQVKFHSYYPFGEEIATTFTSAYADRLRFTGHERDLANVTGQADDLDYMMARHESPLTGRFLSFDPIGGNPRKPQSWNRYAYVLGNPINYTDPHGLLPANCPKEAPRGAYCEDTTSTAYDPLHDIQVGLDILWYGGPVLDSGVSAEFGPAVAREAQLQISAQFGSEMAARELGQPVVGAIDTGAGPLEFGVFSLSAALVRSFGSAAAERAFVAATEFLGPEARVITNTAGDKIFLSEDGLRKIRFDIKRPYPHKSPHAHIDQLVNGKWRPVTGRYGRQIYPRGVPPE